MTVAEKAKALATDLQQSYGKESVKVLTDAASVVDCGESVGTGLHSLDLALGCGGFPRGRSVEIFGWEGSCKSTLTLHAAAKVQARGGLVCFIDAEHALDPQYASNLGVDLDGLILAQPDSGEHAIEIARGMMSSNVDVDMLIVDSITALVPTVDMEGDITDVNMASHPKLINKMFRVLTPLIAKKKTIGLFINQIRHKVGFFMGSPEYTTGGNAPKFYPSVRMKLKVVEKTADLNRIEIDIIKNKVGVPYKKCEAWVRFGLGFDKGYDLLCAGLELGIITQRGSNYYIDNKNIGNGKKAASTNLEDPDLQERWYEEHKKRTGQED